MSLVTREMEISADHLGNLFGKFDGNVKNIEEKLNVNFVLRDGVLRIKGENDAVERAVAVTDELLSMSKHGTEITEQNVNYVLQMSGADLTSHKLSSADTDLICHTASGNPVKPKTLGQKAYVDAIRNHMIVFGTGPAGTGKTYLAIAMAVTAFMRDDVERIILTRPAIEAGEKLGFLPGDLQSKIDPYLRPLFDSLIQIMGQESFQRHMDKGTIEVAPLAYMRGRTLNNSFIILDEAQNTTPAQMKMFLTRIGFGSKAVITGDRTQKDLQPGTASGLDIARRVLIKRVKEISFIDLTGKDVVRHPLVQKIVNAYEEYENECEKSKKNSGGRK
jgi:phosphate starvation-inducible PhoH-like protein